MASFDPRTPATMSESAAKPRSGVAVSIRGSVVEWCFGYDLPPIQMLRRSDDDQQVLVVK